MKIINLSLWHGAAMGTLGAAAGLLCALHCAVVPLATATLLAFGISSFASATVEATVMMTAAGLALTCFWPRATREGNTFPLQLSLLSLTFFLAGWQLSGLSPLLRQSLSVSSGLMLVVAHAQNLWGRRRVCAGRCP